MKLSKYMHAYLIPPEPKLILYRLRWFMMRRMGISKQFIESLDASASEPKWFTDEVRRHHATYIDIGAGVGAYLREARAGVRIGFEPDPRCYRLLKQMDGVIAYRLALWDAVSQAEITYTPSLKHTTMALDRRGSRHMVKTTTLDTLMLDGLLPKLETPILIKIDTEGAEHRILAGMTLFMRAYRPTIIIEYHNNLRETIKALKLASYKPTVHTPNTYEVGFTRGWLKAEPE